MLLGFVVLVAFVVISFLLVKAISRESSIRKEFGISNSLLPAVALFPLGPALVLIAPAIAAPWSILYAAAAAMYIPAFMLSRRQERLLQVAGTNRVNDALRTVERVFGAALCGLIYVAAVSALAWGAGSIRSVGQGA